jgi:predicted nucleic acid-binding protein
LIYIDSNVFLYAALDPGDRGSWCEAVLRKVQQGEEEAATCSLTLDEVLYKSRKHRTLEDSLRAAEAILSFPNLAILPVDADVVGGAIDLIRRYRLLPRDAIHASSALSRGIGVIYSEDDDFDGVRGLKRRWLGL